VQTRLTHMLSALCRQSIRRKQADGFVLAWGRSIR
jgi:hypothetical protein